ncbi:MAG: hypothetical protein IKG40_00135 [Bacilli bacterium]|nr:hypothetical protein [Bacilli bacterium]
MEKKSNKGLIATIIFLILLVLGLGGFIAYDKVINKPEEPKTKKIKKETTNKENLDVVAKLLINKLDKYYVDYYDKKEQVDFENTSDKDLILGAFIYGNNSNLTKAIVDDYYNNLFGRTLTTYPDLNCWINDGIYAKYNPSINEYEKQMIKTPTGEEIDHAHGGPSIVHSIFIKTNKIEKEDDNYIITVTKIYGPAEGLIETPETAFYADAKYQVKINELSSFIRKDSNGMLLTDDFTEAINYYNQNYDTFKTPMPKYKYTFKKSNNDFYLTNFETIKES